MTQKLQTNALNLTTGGPSSQCYPFFPVTYGMYYYITTEFDHAKHDSRLAAYGGVMFRVVKFGRYVIVHAICHGKKRITLRAWAACDLTGPINT